MADHTCSRKSGRRPWLVLAASYEMSALNFAKQAFGFEKPHVCLFYLLFPPDTNHLIWTVIRNRLGRDPDVQ